MPHFCKKPRSSLDKDLLIQQNKAQRIFRQLLFRLIYQQIALCDLILNLRNSFAIPAACVPYARGVVFRSREPWQKPQSLAVPATIVSDAHGIVQTIRPSSSDRIFTTLENLLVITTAGVPDTYSLVIRAADAKKAVPSSHVMTRENHLIS